jgi:fructosamine-3-kinase
MSVWKHIAEQISHSTGSRFSPTSPSGIGGGDINRAFRLHDDSQSYFVKLNTSSLLSMFEAEAAGLQELAQSQTIRVPEPVCFGSFENDSFLVLEYIQISPRGDLELAGRQLAQMHQTFGDRFGWDRDNTIGSTHQPNNLSSDWVEFWQQHRLGYQLKLATGLRHNSRLQQRGEKLVELLPQLIEHKPKPSLLHGDLWGGNIAFDPERRPVIFDPAVYYGDRETDLAMTELFGGFGSSFYAAYNEVWPLDSGYASRRDLYNLYHILNHLNLFGGGYASQAQGMIDRLLAELGE